MAFIIADKNKYITLSNQRDTLKLAKNESVEVSDSEADFLIKTYEDIRLYIKPEETKNKKNKDANLSETNIDNLNNATNTDNQ